MEIEWTTQSVGFRDVLDFTFTWWPFFLLVPFVLGPFLFLFAYPVMKRRERGEKKLKQEIPARKKTRPFLRRLFVDDRNQKQSLEQRIHATQLFTATFFATAATSFCIFALLIGYLVVRAFFIAN